VRQPPALIGINSHALFRYSGLTHINDLAGMPRSIGLRQKFGPVAGNPDGRAMDASTKTNELPGLGPEAYRQWRGSSIGAITEALQRRLILDLLGDVRGLTVLDVGCGDGSLAIELHKRGAIVTGIDRSSAMINSAKVAARQQHAPIPFIMAPAEAIPFPATRFDVVVAVTILCFVEDAAPVFAEIARVLRPGGRFVIGELGKWSSWAAARRIRAWLGSPLWRLGRFRAASELRRLASQAGLDPGAVHGAIYYPRWTPAARVMASWDQRIGRVTTAGAAFLALSAHKPLACS
jgi:2-polyprenyl-3-methyl-5-hydroxy-6-metoxy-1,4-benzoquinol methylase